MLRPPHVINRRPTEIPRALLGVFIVFVYICLFTVHDKASLYLRPPHLSQWNKGDGLVSLAETEQTLQSDNAKIISYPAEYTDKRLGKKLSKQDLLLSLEPTDDATLPRDDSSKTPNNLHMKSISLNPTSNTSPLKEVQISDETAVESTRASDSNELQVVPGLEKKLEASFKPAEMHHVEAEHTESVSVHWQTNPISKDHSAFALPTTVTSVFKSKALQLDADEISTKTISSPDPVFMLTSSYAYNQQHDSTSIKKEEHASAPLVENNNKNPQESHSSNPVAIEEKLGVHNNLMPSVESSKSYREALWSHSSNPFAFVKAVDEILPTAKVTEKNIRGATVIAPISSDTTNFELSPSTNSSPNSKHQVQPPSPKTAETAEQPTLVPSTTPPPTHKPKTPKPTPISTSLPTDIPTTHPTPVATPRPTHKPKTAKPTPDPTSLPTDEPTSHPTPVPTPRPTHKPRTPKPTAVPTPLPTDNPTTHPTPIPTPRPTHKPKTPQPTAVPTPLPTDKPTTHPTPIPTPRPTHKPKTPQPTPVPTFKPTPFPTPTPLPTRKPTPVPTSSPTSKPTPVPTPSPTPVPSPEEEKDVRGKKVKNKTPKKTSNN